MNLRLAGWQIDDACTTGLAARSPLARAAGHGLMGVIKNILEPRNRIHARPIP